MSQPLVQYFSIFTGHLYFIEIDEIKNQDEGQLPLKSPPSKSCKKCHGRGHCGRDVNTTLYVPCTCLGRRIDFDLMKHKVKDGIIEIQTPTLKG